MLEPIVGFFEKLIDDFSWRRLTLLLSTLLAIIIGLWVYELYTANFQLTKLERQTELLVELTDLQSNQSLQESKLLKETYLGVLSSLNKLSVKDESKSVVSRPALQALAALFPWIIFAVILLFLKHDSIAQAVTGMAIFAVPLAMLGYWLPTFQMSWLNFIFYPIVSFGLSVGLVLWWQKKH